MSNRKGKINKNNDENNKEMSGLNPYVPACGAKTRAGTPCKNPAMPNGRCKLHGGKSTGAPKGNKNALKHGAYETVRFDMLEEDELIYIERNKNRQLLQQINDEIQLYNIRERRMLKRIKDLKDGDHFSVVEISESKGVDRGKSKDLVEKKELSNEEQIMRIEEALTRIQEKRTRALELKAKLLETLGDDTEQEDLMRDKMKNAYGQTALEAFDGEEDE